MTCTFIPLIQPVLLMDSDVLVNGYTRSISKNQTTVTVISNIIYMYTRSLKFQAESSSISVVGPESFKSKNRQISSACVNGSRYSIGKAVIDKLFSAQAGKHHIRLQVDNTYSRDLYFKISFVDRGIVHTIKMKKDCVNIAILVDFNEKKWSIAGGPGDECTIDGTHIFNEKKCWNGTFPRRDNYKIRIYLAPGQLVWISKYVNLNAYSCYANYDPVSCFQMGKYQLTDESRFYYHKNVVDMILSNGTFDRYAQIFVTALVYILYRYIEDNKHEQAFECFQRVNNEIPEFCVDENNAAYDCFHRIMAESIEYYITQYKCNKSENILDKIKFLLPDPSIDEFAEFYYISTRGLALFVAEEIYESPTIRFKYYLWHRGYLEKMYSMKCHCTGDKKKHRLDKIQIKTFCYVCQISSECTFGCKKCAFYVCTKCYVKHKWENASSKAEIRSFLMKLCRSAYGANKERALGYFNESEAIDNGKAIQEHNLEIEYADCLIYANDMNKATKYIDIYKNKKQSAFDNVGDCKLDSDILDQLMTFQCGTKSEILNAMKHVTNKNDINEIMDYLASNENNIQNNISRNMITEDVKIQYISAISHYRENNFKKALECFDKIEAIIGILNYKAQHIEFKYAICLLFASNDFKKASIYFAECYQKFTQGARFSFIDPDCYKKKESLSFYVEAFESYKFYAKCLENSDIKIFFCKILAFLYYRTKQYQKAFNMYKINNYIDNVSDKDDMEAILSCLRHLEMYEQMVGYAHKIRKQYPKFNAECLVSEICGHFWMKDYQNAFNLCFKLEKADFDLMSHYGLFGIYGLSMYFCTDNKDAGIKWIELQFYKYDSKNIQLPDYNISVRKSLINIYYKLSTENTENEMEKCVKYQEKCVEHLKKFVKQVKDDIEMNTLLSALG